MSKMCDEWCDECLMGHCSYEPFSEDCQLAKDFRTLEELNKEYLDSLDLSSYLSKSNDIQVIIDLIEKDYDDNENLPSELEGCIFNYLGVEDVAYYLADRYGLHVNEQIIYKYTLYK